MHLESGVKKREEKSAWREKIIDITERKGILL